jgi:hypothetical protein
MADFVPVLSEEASEWERGVLERCQAGDLLGIGDKNYVAEWKREQNIRRALNDWKTSIDAIATNGQVLTLYPLEYTLFYEFGNKGKAYRLDKPKTGKSWFESFFDEIEVDIKSADVVPLNDEDNQTLMQIDNYDSSQDGPSGIREIPGDDDLNAQVEVMLGQLKARRRRFAEKVYNEYKNVAEPFFYQLEDLRVPGFSSSRNFPAVYFVRKFADDDFQKKNAWMIKGTASLGPELALKIFEQLSDANKARVEQFKPSDLQTMIFETPQEIGSIPNDSACFVQTATSTSVSPQTMVSGSYTCPKEPAKSFYLAFPGLESAPAMVPCSLCQNGVLARRATEATTGFFVSH